MKIVVDLIEQITDPTLFFDKIIEIVGSHGVVYITNEKVTYSLTLTNEKEENI